MGQKAPIEMPPMIQMMTTKPVVSSVRASYRIFARARVINDNATVMLTTRGPKPLISIFANHLNCSITWEKFKVFVHKISTSDPFVHKIAIFLRTAIT